jgi:hypothetical protein
MKKQSTCREARPGAKRAQSHAQRIETTNIHVFGGYRFDDRTETIRERQHEKNGSSGGGLGVESIGHRNRKRKYW